MNQVHDEYPNRPNWQSPRSMMDMVRQHCIPGPLGLQLEMVPLVPLLALELVVLSVVPLMVPLVVPLVVPLADRSVELRSLGSRRTCTSSTCSYLLSFLM